MTKKKTPPPQPSEAEPVPVEEKVEETPFEAVASICSVLVVGLCFSSLWLIRIR